MQRPSLGGSSSPGSKHIHGVSSSKEVIRLFDQEQDKQDSTPTPTPTRKDQRGGVLVVSDNIIHQEEEDKEEKKTEKHRHHHHLRSISQTEKSIHLIPILTIFCLLVLYLCSYDPPLKDLAHIDGFRRISNRLDSTEISGGHRRFSELEIKADVLPIRSHRSLHEIRKDGRKTRLHRKIGDY